MTKPYSMPIRQKMIARLTGPNAVSATQLARETGIAQQNLSRWLCEARNLPFAASGDGIVFWTVQQKARIIAQAAALAGEELTNYLEREGVKLECFRRWRLALEGAGEEFLSMTKRIRKLERELMRKDRVLAEAATLLVLRETIDSVIEKNADGIELLNV
jgi:transposase